MTKHSDILAQNSRGSGNMPKLLFSVFFLWISVKLFVRYTDAAHPYLPRDPPIPDPPNSSDVQRLTEALYFDGAILYEEDFPRDKEPVDVCTLSADKALKVCEKAERQCLYKGKYFLESNAKVAACELRKFKLHHTTDKTIYEDKRVLRCPLQPEPLFLLSGNTRVPVFILTWSDKEKTSVHLDFYMNVDKELL